MIEKTVQTAVRHHRLVCPDEKRTDEELTEYYQRIVEGSPFTPLVEMMEAEEEVFEVRLRKTLTPDEFMLLTKA